ncbi:MAG: hypothetical protein ACI9WU_002114 [Myxococcota bacterium]|jgi:hypothetical protein
MGVDAVTWAGPVAVVDTPAELVLDHCLVCGTDQDVSGVQKVYQDAPLTAIARSSETVDLSLCRRCDSRWIRSDRVYLVTVGGGIVALPILGGYQAGQLGVENDVLLGTFTGLLVWLLCVIAVRLLLVLPRQIRCVRLRNKTVSLEFPRARMARRLIDQASATIL